MKICLQVTYPTYFCITCIHLVNSKDSDQTGCTGSSKFSLIVLVAHSYIRQGGIYLQPSSHFSPISICRIPSSPGPLLPILLSPPILLFPSAWSLCSHHNHVSSLLSVFCPSPPPSNLPSLCLASPAPDLRLSPCPPHLLLCLLPRLLSHDAAGGSWVRQRCHYLSHQGVQLIFAVGQGLLSL